MLPSQFNLRVVGVTFVDGYPENLHKLMKLDEQRDQGAEMMAVVLRRNPNNPHHANAIEVHVPSVGMIGHVNKEVASRLAPEMDNSANGVSCRRFKAGVLGVRMWPDKPEQPGISIRVEAHDDHALEPDGHSATASCMNCGAVVV